MIFEKFKNLDILKTFFQETKEKDVSGKLKI